MMAIDDSIFGCWVPSKRNLQQAEARGHAVTTASVHLTAQLWCASVNQTQIANQVALSPQHAVSETSRTSKMVLERTRVLGMTSSHAPVALFFLRAAQVGSRN